MPHNEQLLPSNTKLIWEPAEKKTERVARIYQHDGVFVFNYEAPLDPRARQSTYLTPKRGAALACTFLGLTTRQAATYQGRTKNAIKTNLRLAYRQLHVNRQPEENTSHFRGAHALSRLCELGIMELGRPATLTNALTPLTHAAVQGLLAGNSFPEVATQLGESPDALKKEFYEARDEEGFDTSMGYILHLVGAQAIGTIRYKPELMPPRPPMRQMHTNNR